MCNFCESSETRYYNSSKTLTGDDACPKTSYGLDDCSKCKHCIDDTYSMFLKNSILSLGYKVTFPNNLNPAKTITLARGSADIAVKFCPFCGRKLK